MLKKLLFLLNLSLLPFFAASAAPVPEQMVLVKNNVARFRIVCVDKPSVELRVAVNAIIDMTRQATGAEVDWIGESKLASADKNMINLHLGMTDFVRKANLNLPKPAGFVIRFVDDKNVILAGYPSENDVFNSIDAASHFLEHFMKVRFLMPGELGTHVPKMNDWIIKPENIREVPDVWVRSHSGVHGQAFERNERHQQKQAFEWALRTRNSAGKTFRYNHNIGYLIDPEKYAETHPEFFPLINGKRRIPPKTGDRRWKLFHWEPCYTAPGIAEEAAKNLIEYFDKNPTSFSQSLSVNDAGDICRCEKCTAKNAALPDGSESQSYYEWVAKTVSIANKKYPDRRYGFLNYWVTREMPENVKLPGNVIPIICEDLKFYVDPELDKQLEERLEKWGKLVSQIGWWDYGFEGAYAVPHYNARYLAKKLRYLYKKHNLRVYTDELHPGRHWKSGPQVYMVQKLLWNIDVDEEALLDEWFELMVGKEATPYFKQYFAIWENFWTNKIPETDWFRNRAERKAPFLQRRDSSYLDALDIEDVNNALKLLDQTVAAAPEGVHKIRAEFFRNYFIDAADRILLPYINSRTLGKQSKNLPGKTVCEYTFDNSFQPWVPWQLPKHTARLTLDKNTGFKKKGSLKLDRNRSLETGMVFFRRPLDFKLEAGKNYRISVWTKAENFNWESTLTMTLYFPLKNGSFIGSEPRAAGRLNYSDNLKYNELKDGKWHKLEVCVAVPKNAWNDVAGINCQLECDPKLPNTTVWFDDFKVEELPSNAIALHPETGRKQAETDEKPSVWRDPETGELLGQELLVDGDMELPHASCWRENHQPKIKEKSSKVFHSGKRSMRLVSASGGPGIYQILRPALRKELFIVPFKAMKVGSEYRVQLWIKYSDPKHFKDIRLPGTTLKKEVLKNPDTNWHKHVFRIKCEKPVSTDFLTIGYGEGRGECFIDDVSIREIIKK